MPVPGAAIATTKTIVAPINAGDRPRLRGGAGDGNIVPETGCLRRGCCARRPTLHAPESMRAKRGQPVAVSPRHDPAHRFDLPPARSLRPRASGASARLLLEKKLPGLNEFLWISR